MPRPTITDGELRIPLEWLDAESLITIRADVERVATDPHATRIDREAAARFSEQLTTLLWSAT